MVERISPSPGRSGVVAGLLCIALGALPVSIALGLIPVNDSRVPAPVWALTLSGLVFMVGGCMILLRNRSSVNDVLAGILCLLFGVLGAWIALFGSSEAFSGGIGFLPHELNVRLGRGVFGVGALFCFAIAAYAFRRAMRSSRVRQG